MTNQRFRGRGAAVALSILAAGTLVLASCSKSTPKETSAPDTTAVAAADTTAVAAADTTAAAVADTKPFSLFEWMLSARYLRARR